MPSSAYLLIAAGEDVAISHNTRLSELVKFYASRHSTALHIFIFSCNLAIARKCCKFGRIYLPRKWRPPKIGGPMRTHSSRSAKAGTEWEEGKDRGKRERKSVEREGSGETPCRINFDCVSVMLSLDGSRL